MAVIEIAKIQVRRGQENTTGIPQLDSGEFGWAEDTENLYIGKRIVDGAADDNNTRILTENDLNFFKLAVQNTGTVNSQYTYRWPVSLANSGAVGAYINSTSTTIQAKLDSFDPSLTDFGVIPSFTATDITIPLQTAIQTLFNNGTFNDWRRTDARRQLLIPPGNYQISSTIQLPPYTSLLGAGPDQTTITFIAPQATTVNVTTSATVITSGTNTTTIFVTGTNFVQSLFWLTGGDHITGTGIPANTQILNFQVTSTGTYLNLQFIGGATSATVTATELVSISGSYSLANMFQTVDAAGNVFNSNLMQSGIQAAKDVFIEGMTLQFTNTATISNSSLLSIDNVKTAKIRNVKFTTQYDTTSTSTYGITTHGVGLSIRGSGGGVYAGDANLCQDIFVEDCVFDGLYQGIVTTGSVVRTVINDNLFSNLYNGVVFSSTGTTISPSNASITRNRFRSIVQQGVYVGPSPGNNIIQTNHVSSENFFVQVGNGLDGNNSVILDDKVTTSTGATAILTFLAPGNKSVNDQFYRRTVGNTTTDSTWYYNPIIEGRACLDDGNAFTATSVAGTVTPFVRIPINNHVQEVNMRYQLTNADLARVGNLLINVAQDGSTSVTDTFNYSQSLQSVPNGGGVFPVIANSGVGVFAVDTGAHPLFATLTNNALAAQNWYIVGDGVGYGSGIAAQLTGVSPGPGNIAIFNAQVSPALDFSVTLPGGAPANSYSLYTTDSAPSNFQTQANVDRNYVTVEITNGSGIANYELEYQLNILG